MIWFGRVSANYMLSLSDIDTSRLGNVTSAAAIIAATVVIISSSTLFESTGFQNLPRPASPHTGLVWTQEIK